MRYSIKDFRKDFPDDKTCLAFIFEKRYPNGIKCACGKDIRYPVINRRAYACSSGHQIYPTEGTIFHKSATPLTSWFYAMFLMSQSKNGVSAKEIQRQLGVTYKCAWRIAHQIRKLMKDDGGTLSGIVEVDEAYIGGHKATGKGRFKGSHAPILGMAQRGGKVKAKMVPDTKTNTLLPELQKTVEPGTEVHTDGGLSYQLVPRLGFKHETVKHSAKEWVRGNVHTNTIESFWGQLKRSIGGTYHSVSKKHLPAYLDEFSYRFDRRFDFEPLPVSLLSRAGMRV